MKIKPQYTISLDKDSQSLLLKICQQQLVLLPGIIVKPSQILSGLCRVGLLQLHNNLNTRKT